MIVYDHLTWLRFQRAFDKHEIIEFLGGWFVITELHDSNDGKRTAKVVQVLPVTLPRLHPPETPA